MKKWKDAIRKDLWVVLLDIVAVNLSYFLALIIRFFDNRKLRPEIAWLHAISGLIISRISQVDSGYCGPQGKGELFRQLVLEVLFSS